MRRRRPYNGSHLHEGPRELTHVEQFAGKSSYTMNAIYAVHEIEIFSENATPACYSCRGACSGLCMGEWQPAGRTAAVVCTILWLFSSGPSINSKPHNSVCEQTISAVDMFALSYPKAADLLRYARKAPFTSTTGLDKEVGTVSHAPP